MNKAVFLDRDGVINYDNPSYTWKLEDFVLIEGVAEALGLLREAGFRLAILTNQSGIAKGLYTAADVLACHQKLQSLSGGAIDVLYYAPLHERVSRSLARKPGTLMFERAMGRLNVRPENVWMVGDKERDLAPARQVGIPGRIFVTEGHAEPEPVPPSATHVVRNLLEAVQQIILPG